MRDRSPARRVAETLFQVHAAAYTFTVLLVVMIWAITGFGYFWPAWVAVPWGFGLGFHGWATWALPAQLRR